MKLKEVKLKNFRGYKTETTITFEDLTILIGRNDAGKSTILEALDVFFNDGAIDNDDVSVGGDARDVRITCVFSELPDEIILDEQHPTSLKDEYLLREDDLLEITRVFNCTSSKGKQSAIFARALHPSAETCGDLLTLKIRDLKSRATEVNVDLEDVNQTIKTAIRRAIWESLDDLQLSEAEVDLTSESGKTVWAQIKENLPVFAIFKSDRPSKDDDPEAQDPMKTAIKEVMKSHEHELNSIVSEVRNELETVVNKTVEKLKEMNPVLAETLNPKIKNKPWDGLFSVSLAGDEGIPMNKRGSGTRRLVLLNFFRAKAEDASIARNTGTIYAIEEPETSQHPNHQVILMDAFQDLTARGTAQVILTTHNPTLARKIDQNSLRFIGRENGNPIIKHGESEETLKLIRDTLGVLPDHDVKVFVGVEGKWDIEFLKRISKKLHISDESIPDLEHVEKEGKLVFIPLGGSSMELWISRMSGFNLPEIYITDRDNKLPKYQSSINEWNARENCKAFFTSKREMENFLHPTAIKTIEASFPDIIADFDDVPKILARCLHNANPDSGEWDSLTSEKIKKKTSRAKERLNKEATETMTVELLTESDPDGEITTYLRQIAEHL